MNENRPIYKNREFWIRICLIAAAAAFVILLFGQQTSCSSNRKDPEEDPMGYSYTEIQEIIAAENRTQKQLIVYEQDLEAALDIKDMFLNIEWFLKKQTVHLSATADYIVDLSQIDAGDVIVDRNQQTITVTIPRAELKNVVIDFSKTTFDDIERNIFGWGDIKLTPEQQNEVEKQLQEALYEEARKTPYLSAADSAAMRQVESMYQSVLTQLNPEYRIVAVLDMNLNQGN